MHTIHSIINTIITPSPLGDVLITLITLIISPNFINFFAAFINLAADLISAFFRLSQLTIPHISTSFLTAIPHTIPLATALI